MNTQTQKTLHPLILHAKTLLIFMSAILILANLYLINSTRDLSKSYSSHTNQAIWFLFQLNKEFTEMLALSPYLLESESNQRDVMVKYELTWSRFDLILNSPEADGIIGMPSTREFFQAAFARFKQLEPLLLAAKNPESLQLYCCRPTRAGDFYSVHKPHIWNAKSFVCRAKRETELPQSHPVCVNFVDV